MRKWYFSKAKSSVWTHRQRLTRTLGENMNYPVKLLCTSPHVLYYCRITSYEGGTGGLVTRPRAGWLKNCGLIPCAGKTFFSAPSHSDWLWVPHSLLFSGYLGLLLTPACSAPVKNEQSYTSALPYVFITCMGTTSTFNRLWGLLWTGEKLTWPYVNL